MQTVTVNTLGFKLNYDVPSTVEEFDKLAKRSGAALDEANKNVIYRSVLATARDAILHGLDEEKDEAGVVTRSASSGLDKVSGIERKVEVTKPEVKDEAGNITQEEVSKWAEKEEEFKNRVLAEQVASGVYPSIEAAQAAYQTLAQEIISSIAFDPSKSERAATGPKKTPKTYVAIADSLIEMKGSVEAACASFTAKTGRAVEATKDALAKAIWEDQTAQKKAIAAGYAS